MNIPQIRVTKTDIQMDYTITAPQQTIRQPRAEQSIEQPAATLEIRTTDPKMTTDWSQFNEDVGLKPTSKLVEEYAQKGRQEMLQGMSRRVQEGRQMMLGAGKNRGSDTIKSIAMQNTGPQLKRTVALDFIPSYQAIKVNIEPGTTDINIEQNAPQIDVKTHKPQIDFQYGDVTGKMIVRPDVQVDVVG